MYVYATPDDVDPKFGAWSNRVKWCEENCVGRWEYKLNGVFEFYLDRDYSMFLLRWT